MSTYGTRHVDEFVSKYPQHNTATYSLNGSVWNASWQYAWAMVACVIMGDGGDSNKMENM